MAVLLGAGSRPAAAPQIHKTMKRKTFLSDEHFAYVVNKCYDEFKDEGFVADDFKEESNDWYGDVLVRIQDILTECLESDFSDFFGYTYGERYDLRYTAEKLAECLYDKFNDTNND